MAYNIRHLANAGLIKKLYFFDANFWLKMLRPPFDLTDKDKKYLVFFEKFKNNANHPRIAVTALVLSEVTNRYLRNVSYIKYLKKNPSASVADNHYKEIYRASQQFVQDYNLLCEDIKSYQNLYDLVPDGLGSEIKQKDILTSPPASLDFNDNYYYQLAKKRGYTIVTDDKDFFVQDVEILTLNNVLLDRAKATVIPVKK